MGLILGGLLTSADLFGWGWRSVFFVNIPIALAALAGSFRAMPRPGSARAAGSTSLEPSCAPRPWSPSPTAAGRAQPGLARLVLALLAAGVATLVLLGLIEARRQHHRVAPLLRTKLFPVPAFTTGLIVQFAFAAGIQGFFLIFTLWVQASTTRRCEPG